MVDTNTAKYLNDNIGAVLSQALSEMAVQQPNDGVDFLAKWLSTYAEQEEAKIFREREEKQVAEERALTQQKEAEKKAKREQKAATKKSLEDAYTQLLAKFNDETKAFNDAYWTDLVNVAKQFMGAQSVYLGILDEEGLEGAEPPLVRYSHENIFAGSPSLLDKILPKMRDAETTNITFGALTESVPEEEQASKYLWKPTPPPQPPVPEGEEPPPPPEGPKYLPVSVPCVTDVANMHYFEMPRLGAYLAMPLVYPTYYTQEAFDEAKKFEEEKAADLLAKQEKERQRAEEIAEAREKDPDAPLPEHLIAQEEEAQPEKVMTLPGTTTRMVLCMDTLGTNTLFDESKYEALMALCDACSACKARSEIKEIDDQALFAMEGTGAGSRRTAADDAESETSLLGLREKAKLQFQEQQDQDLKEISDRGLEADPKKAVEEISCKKFAFLQANAVCANYKDEIKKWLSVSVTAKPEVANVLAGLAFLAGYTKEEVYPPRKAQLKWDRIKDLLNNDAFFAKLAKVDLAIGSRKGLTNEQKLSFIQSLLPAEFSEEKAKEIDPAFEVLWGSLSSAVDFRSSALKQAQAEYNERKKAAEESEQAFEEPDLGAVDDDFEGLLAAA